MKTKFAIGCLVQWYESKIFLEYLSTLKSAINLYDGEVIVDITLSVNQDLEKTNLDREGFFSLKADLLNHIDRELPGCTVRVAEDLVTIADYRREFNSNYCTEVDVLVWGESDMLVPKQMFSSLDLLHRTQSKQTPKYLATFGICKMWDDTWKPLEHVEFTDKPFIDGDNKNWWSLRYVMSEDEMNTFNDKVQSLDLSIVSPHKFNGCGLVISSEVIKAGVNIPKSVFFIHEDTAFMLMTQKVLGNIPQYHFRNILLVHNRKHPEKRNYILGEENVDKADVGGQRKVHDWYVPANKLCEQNVYNLFNPNYKAKTWKDVWK